MNKSIIRVEQPDVHLDEEDEDDEMSEQPQAMEAASVGDEQPAVNGNGGNGEPELWAKRRSAGIEQLLS